MNGWGWGGHRVYCFGCIARDTVRDVSTYTICIPIHTYLYQVQSTAVALKTFAAYLVCCAVQVCSCNNVDKGTIYRSVTEDGLTTVAQVKSCTKV